MFQVIYMSFYCCTLLCLYLLIPLIVSCLKKNLLAKLYALYSLNICVEYRLYGLPKTHKTDIPLRSILSMVDSSQHEQAKFLAVTLQPDLEHYSSFCIQDSFSFAELIRQFHPII